MNDGTKDPVSSSIKPPRKPTSSSQAHDTQLGIDIKNPDTVQQGLVGGWHWVEHNAKLVVAFFVVGALAAVGYLVVHYLGQYQERSAQQAFYDAQVPFQKSKEGFEKAKMKSLMPQLAQQEDPAAPGAAAAVAATGDLQKDYGPMLAKLEEVARNHSGTAGGAQAAILVAETYLEYKQPDKAIEFAQMPANKMSNGHLLSQLSKMLWGNALATKGDCAAAIGVWQQVLDVKSAGYLHPDANLRSGMCLEQIGQADRALEMYRKVSLEAPDSAAANQAKGFMRALELKAAPQAAAAQAPAAAAPAAAATGK